MSDASGLFRRPTRREFLTFGAGVFVALSWPLSRRRRLAVARRTYPLMGTIAEVQVAHADDRTAEAAIDSAIATLLGVERAMTRFDAASDIGRANARAAREGVLIGAPTAAVVAGQVMLWLLCPGLLVTAFVFMTHPGRGSEHTANTWSLAAAGLALLM